MRVVVPASQMSSLVKPSMIRSCAAAKPFNNKYPTETVSVKDLACATRNSSSACPAFHAAPFGRGPFEE